MKAGGGFFYRSVYGRDYGEAKEKLAMAKLGMVCHGPEEDLAAKIKIGNQNNADKNSGAVLFSQAATEWLVEVSSKRKYSTYIKYETVYRAHLAATIGSCKLSTFCVVTAFKYF